MDKVKQNIIQQQQLDKFNIEKSVIGTEAYYINQDIQKGMSGDEIIEKARSGVYKLTAENKKAGRVGQRYGAEHSEKPGYSQKEHGEEEFEGQRGPGEDKWNKKESTDKKEGKKSSDEMVRAFGSYKKMPSDKIIKEAFEEQYKRGDNSTYQKIESFKQAIQNSVDYHKYND